MGKFFCKLGEFPPIGGNLATLLYTIFCYFRFHFHLIIDLIPRKRLLQIIHNYRIYPKIIPFLQQVPICINSKNRFLGRFRLRVREKSQLKLSRIRFRVVHLSRITQNSHLRHSSMYNSLYYKFIEKVIINIFLNLKKTCVQKLI